MGRWAAGYSPFQSSGFFFRATGTIAPTPVVRRGGVQCPEVPVGLEDLRRQVSSLHLLGPWNSRIRTSGAIKYERPSSRQ